MSNEKKDDEASISSLRKAAFESQYIIIPLLHISQPSADERTKPIRYL
jgi:hypothetical protein